MENISHSEISMDNYRKIESGIDSMINTEELIETHKQLVGNSSKSDYYEVKDCGVEFIKKLLSRDWGRTIVYHYSQGAQDFIHSKYLSDYFKNSIKELLLDEDLSDEVLSILNSDKVVNDMSEAEILLIHSAIKDFYHKSTNYEKDNVANYFMSFLYKLNGKGVVSYIKNNVNNNDLASHILTTSGLNDRASYYSGRGVNYGDLSDKNLEEMFRKLLKIDLDYAMNFIDMVRQMKTLGATEFINSFMSFASNDFKSDISNIEDSNVSLDGVYDEARDMVAFSSIFSLMSRGNDQDYQTRASEQMKKAFLSRIKPVLKSINIDLDDGNLGSESFGSSYKHKRK